MNIIEEIKKGVDGLHLPDAEKNTALETIRTQLIVRVGIEITENVTEEDMVAFNIAAEKDDMQALELLDAKIPNFEAIVKNELQQLIEEYAFLS